MKTLPKINNWISTKTTGLLTTGFFLYSAVCVQAAPQLSWSAATAQKDGGISTWLNTVLLVIMSIFIMVSVILGSLAFKQLAADGNWKDFWSKIAGAIGMFIVPVVVYWVITIPAGPTN